MIFGWFYFATIFLDVASPSGLGPAQTHSRLLRGEGGSIRRNAPPVTTHTEVRVGYRGRSTTPSANDDADGTVRLTVTSAPGPLGFAAAEPGGRGKETAANAVPSSSSSSSVSASSRRRGSGNLALNFFHSTFASSAEQGGQGAKGQKESRQRSSTTLRSGSSESSLCSRASRAQSQSVSFNLVPLTLPLQSPAQSPVQNLYRASAPGLATATAAARRTLAATAALQAQAQRADQRARARTLSSATSRQSHGTSDGGCAVISTSRLDIFADGDDAGTGEQEGGGHEYCANLVEPGTVFEPARKRFL